MTGDLPALAARFAAACRDAGLPVGPDRAERLTRAVLAAEPATTRRLYHCALATLVTDPAQIPVLERVFAAVFGGLVDEAEHRGDPGSPPLDPAPDAAGPAASGWPGAAGNGIARTGGRTGDRPDRPAETPVRAAASAAERLASRDFDVLTPEELRVLAAAMRRFGIATPPRRSRRTRRAGYGRRIDLRTTLRGARRTAGDPVRLVRRTRRPRPRRLVVLCDISGSMEPYARALLQLLYCAGGAARAEIFTFATRLTRLTRALAHTTPAVALQRASTLAPDWSGGTRIGEALKRFLDDHGARGMARGAVVLIISDGWDTGDPDELGAQMARLSRLAHRVVWANPRTRHADYRPLVGGMAAALPYCDALVSAHRLDALGELLAALADGGPATRRVRPGG
ncbi:vWA domain-containing protein [Pseudonocardia asaccharolytica]|uniref:vWA domain-containing protein n=1 Tax=Pseudonocardia asaccharolytica TaxID=54010 RepID=UPI000426070D|nr:VWA domain-containing protein [Pseudonocardia asaccharolytica]